MARLREKGLDTLVPALTCPVLGICIGMQLLCRSSEEGDAACLGIFPTDVVRLPDRTADGPLKVPHMGWDTVDMLRGPLFATTSSARSSTPKRAGRRAAGFYATS